MLRRKQKGRAKGLPGTLFVAKRGNQATRRSGETRGSSAEATTFNAHVAMETTALNAHVARGKRGRREKVSRADGGASRNKGVVQPKGWS